MANELADSIVTYTWRDLNGNKRFDPGEVNFDPNGPDFVSRRVEVGQALQGAVPNPNEKEPMSHEVSLSLEKSFRLLDGHELALQANIYNVLNINKALGVTPLSGPNFLIPTSITPPRIGEVGITYTF